MFTGGKQVLEALVEECEECFPTWENVMKVKWVKNFPKMDKMKMIWR
jgi:hypothetical protein